MRTSQFIDYKMLFVAKMKAWVSLCSWQYAAQRLEQAFQTKQMCSTFYRVRNNKGNYEFCFFLFPEGDQNWSCDQNVRDLFLKHGSNLRTLYFLFRSRPVSVSKNTFSFEKIFEPILVLLSAQHLYGTSRNVQPHVLTDGDWSLIFSQNRSITALTDITKILAGSSIQAFRYRSDNSIKNSPQPV